MPLFLFIFNILEHTYIHSITFVQYIYPSPFAGASLHLLTACQLTENIKVQWEKLKLRGKTNVSSVGKPVSSVGKTKVSSVKKHVSSVGKTKNQWFGQVGQQQFTAYSPQHITILPKNGHATVESIRVTNLALIRAAIKECIEGRLQVQIAFQTEVDLAPSRPEQPCKEYGQLGRSMLPGG